MDGAAVNDAHSVGLGLPWGLGARAVPVRVLSGGKSAVAPSRLLCRRSTLWMDEPHRALDVKAVELLGTLINEHLTAGGMAVLTSHQTMPLPGGRSYSCECTRPPFSVATFTGRASQK